VTRDPAEEPDDQDDEPAPAGHVQVTGPGPLVVWGLLGLVLGWLLRPVSIAVAGSAPTVPWLPILALLLVAVIVGSVAWSTFRTVHRRAQRIAPHMAVNRLVLAKSCALVGALAAGGYFGYALSWWGIAEASLSQERMNRSLVGGLVGIAVMATSLALERACRVGPGRGNPLQQGPSR
jgi:hypothetical protein